jgi:hypothetical protein
VLVKSQRQVVPDRDPVRVHHVIPVIMRINILSYPASEQQAAHESFLIESNRMEPSLDSVRMPVVDFSSICDEATLRTKLSCVDIRLSLYLFSKSSLDCIRLALIRCVMLSNVDTTNSKLWTALVWVPRKSAE